MTPSRWFPTPFLGAVLWWAVSLGQEAVSDAGAARGRNDSGETAAPAVALDGVAAIAVGFRPPVALKADVPDLALVQDLPPGTAPPHCRVEIWGVFNSPPPDAALSNIVAIAAGYAHFVALKTDGSVLAWGDNQYGQTRVPAAAQSDVIAIAAGDAHTVALKNDGAVVAWGAFGPFDHVNRGQTVGETGSGWNGT